MEKRMTPLFMLELLVVVILVVELVFPFRGK
jgi:hypothetical protein